MKYKNNVNGILVVNKPKGLTSRDVVNEVQKLLNTKAGHTGTLDPIASGVLVITLGKATKLNNILTSTIKEYKAEAKLGVSTDTLDITGNIINTKDKVIPKDKLIDILNSFIGTYNQEVPKYSAVKINGKKLYEYARENIEVSLPKRNVTIYDIKLLDYNNTFTFYTKVSKGTYIRSLIRDIGESLDTYASMTNLERISQGKFKIEEAYTLEDIKEGNYKILKIKDVLDIDKVVVDDNLKKKIINGQKLDLDYSEVLFLDKDQKELAIYEKINNELRVKIMF